MTVALNALFADSWMVECDVNEVEGFQKGAIMDRVARFLGSAAHTPRLGTPLKPLTRFGLQQNLPGLVAAWPFLPPPIRESQCSGTVGVRRTR